MGGAGLLPAHRQLHRAARVILDQHGGRFPRDAQVVRSLPGVGRYTAGAILSIAFDDPQPILEANTVRLFARLLAFGGVTTSTHGQRLLWRAAERLLPRRGAGTFNQALMELGSQVCTPRNPRCDACPLAALCPTRRWHLADKIPAPKVKPIIEEVREAAVVVRRGRRVLLLLREAGERWAGMWDFPRFPLSDAKGDGEADEIVVAVARATGQQVKPGRLLTTIRHSVTRFRISLSCYEAAHIRPVTGPRQEAHHEMGDAGRTGRLPAEHVGPEVGAAGGRHIRTLLTMKRGNAANSGRWPRNCSFGGARRILCRPLSGALPDG